MKFFSKTLHILAQTWSVLLHPLWMPTVGVLLYKSQFIQQENLNVFWQWVIIGTFILTAVLPLLMILLRILIGKARSLEIENAHERTIPYVFTSICYIAWCVLFQHVLSMPHYVTNCAIGATVAIGLVTIINTRWKISAHLTGLGGLIGTLVSCTSIMQIHITIWCILSTLAGILLLMYARIYVRAHTPLQVVLGFLLGLCLTFLPNYIQYYATI